MDLNTHWKQDFKEDTEERKETRNEMREIMEGKNVHNAGDHLDFKTLQKMAQRYRKIVHAQDVLETSVNHDLSQRAEILKKMQNYTQLLQLKVERRRKVHKNAKKSLQQMDIKEICDELEYLRNGLIMQTEYTGLRCVRYASYGMTHTV